MYQTLSSKDVQKNMLKTYKFTKNKLRHRCFHNNLQKIFQTNILENGTGQTLLMVVLMISDLNVKWRQLNNISPSLLAVKEMYYFEFLELHCIHLQRHILDPAKHLR